MQELLADRDGAILTLTINRPDRRNAMNRTVIAALTEQLNLARGDSGLRAIVLTGTGDKAFCSGADLESDKSFKNDSIDPRNVLANLFRVSRSVDVPIIGRINGSCVAGGMGLLGICDLAIAAEHALFGLPEAKVGVFPMQVLVLLRQFVSWRRLIEMAMTGTPITAATAVQWGLLNGAVPTDRLDAEISSLLARISACSPTALRRGSYALRAIENMSFEEAVSFMEGQIALLSLTSDAQEGIRAYREKRPPDWKPRSNASEPTHPL